MLKVVAVLIKNKDKILVTKIEDGEDKLHTVEREIKEEFEF